jgi:hypothetical protein
MFRDHLRFRSQILNSSLHAECLHNAELVQLPDPYRKFEIESTMRMGLAFVG